MCRFIKTLKQHVHAGILNLNIFTRTLLPYVTEKEGPLEEFVKWYKGQNIKGGLSSVAAINVNTRAPGQKQGAKCQRNTIYILVFLWRF